MAAFPTLTVVPSFPLDPDGVIEDVVLRSDLTAGYTQTRPRTTRTRRTWGVRYSDMPAADVTTLKNFEKVTLVNGADAFTWTHPLGGTYNVQLTAPINFATTRGANLADVAFMLREV